MFATPDFWVAVGFLVFLAIVLKPAVKMILSSLDTRAEKIRASLDDAAKLHEEAQSLLAEYQRKQREATKEIEDIVANARTEAQRMVADAEKSLEASLKRREQLAHDKIAQAEADAVAEVRNHAVDLAIEATRRLLTERVDASASSSLVDEAIKDLPGRLN